MSLETRYDIQPPIHIGQVATAHPANQRGLNRKVLLKIIHPQWARDAELVERFSREGRAMASVNHPNVVRVYDYGQEGELSYLALEWVDGGTLTDMMRGAPLSQEKTKRIASELLMGLEAVHNAGLLHRDIKPDNILFTRDGTLKLSDFSLAGFQASSGLTSQGAIIGSPAYMAPELLEGDSAGIASDLYGIGVVLFETLTGSNPFSASDPLVSLDLVRRIKPPKLVSRQQIDPHLARLIDSLLERLPADRPQTAAEALALLEGVVPTGMTESAVPAAEAPDEPQRAEPVVVEVLPLPKRATKRPVLITSLAVVGLIIALLVLLRPMRVSIIPEKPDSLIPMVAVQPDPVDTVAPAPELVTEPDTKKPVLGTVPIGGQNDSSAVQIPKPRTGLLTVFADPWAGVWIGDDSVGVTPLKQLSLPVGIHRLRLTHSQFPTVQREITVKPDSRDTLFVELQKEAGSLTVTAIPWGYLWIDGDSIGILPHSDPLWLTPGRHKIEVRHPSLTTWGDDLVISKGARHRLTVNLPAGTSVSE